MFVMPRKVQRNFRVLSTCWWNLNCQKIRLTCVLYVRIGAELSLWKYRGEKLPTDWKARWIDEWNFLPWSFSSWCQVEDEGCVEFFLRHSSLPKDSKLIISDCSQFPFIYLNIKNYIENASICSQLSRFCDQIYSTSLVSQTQSSNNFPNFLNT